VAGGTGTLCLALTRRAAHDDRDPIYERSDDNGP